MPGRLLLIAQPNSYRIAPYIKAAHQMGMEILIASRGEYSLITEVHEGLNIDFDKPDEAIGLILEEAKKKPFSGVLGSDDSTVELAARVAEKLDLPHNPPDAARASRRKDLARIHLQSAGCPVPKHTLIDLSKSLDEQLADITYPCVLKPLNLSASRGVIRANNKEEFTNACDRIHAITQSENTDPIEQHHLLVEQYIDGEEIAFEGFLQEGTLTQLVIFDKPEPLIGPCFEETIYVTPSALSETKQTLVRERVQQACDAYGLTTGPVHAELRINDEDAWILEVASRTIGGDCGRTLDTGQGLNIEALTITLATGQQPNVETPEGARGVMMLPIPGKGLLKRVEGLTEARNVDHIKAVEIVIPEGHKLIPLPEGNQYPGYIFAEADTREQVIQALQTAQQKLNFILRPLLEIQYT